MATTSTEAQRAAPDALQQFLEAFEREHATTLRVLRAFPPDRLELRPHPRSKSARELAWLFAAEGMLALQALTTGVDFSRPPVPAPQSLDEIVERVDGMHRQVRELVEGLPAERLAGTVRFPVAPHTMGDVPVLQFLWLLLCDQIHHRGQFSVYLRLADARVPSIYGPSADEPWM